MPMSSLITARLFIRFQIFVGQFLVRFERHVGVAPEMKAEGPHSPHDRHDNAEHDPDRDRHVLGAFGIPPPKTSRTGQGLSRRGAEEKTDSENDSRLHVMMR